MECADVIKILLAGFGIAGVAIATLWRKLISINNKALEMAEKQTERDKAFLDAIGKK